MCIGTQCICSLHVYGNYCQTGRISLLIELRESFTLHKQDKSSDAYKSLVSLNSNSVQHQIIYHDPLYYHLVHLNQYINTGKASSKPCLWPITDTECQVWAQML